MSPQVELLLIAGGVIAALLLMGILGTVLVWLQLQTQLLRQKLQKRLGELDTALVPFGQSWAGQSMHTGLLELIELIDDYDDPLVTQLARTLMTTGAWQVVEKRFSGSLGKLDAPQVQRFISDKMEEVLQHTAKLLDGKQEVPHGSTD